MKENPITPGCKLTGRYGNKGVVTFIEKDEAMPINEYGERVDICLNPLGIINRLNLSQIQEQYLNFMSDNLIRKLKELNAKNNITGMEDEFFSYMKLINRQEYDFLDLEYMSMNRSQKVAFFDDILTNGLYIHQPPFFGNTPMEVFVKLFKEKPYLSQMYHLKVLDNGIMKSIEKPMITGDLYFLRLKHESSNKLSARSTGLTNTKNLPSKSTLKKEKKVLYSHTPIRLGEMEVTNLMITRHPEMVEALLKSYSTSEEDRNHLVYNLQTLKDPINMKIQLEDDYSINRKILEKYLNVLELGLEN